MPVGKKDGMMYRVVQLKNNCSFLHALNFIGSIGPDEFLGDINDKMVGAHVTYRYPEEKLDLKEHPQD